ncbi:MAG: TolB family protein [Cyclobacteriaceae bacterium]
MRQFIILLLIFDFCNPSFGQGKPSVFHQSVEWSPDSERLVFAAIVLDSGKYDAGKWEIYSVGSDGSDLSRVTNNGFQDLWPSWSPSGKAVYFDSDVEGDMEILKYEVHKKLTTRLTYSPGKDREPVMSPDGSTIAFVSTRDGNNEIYLMNADGTNTRRLTNSPYNEYNPQWSPDGNNLVYYYDKGDRKDQLYITHVSQSGKPQQLTFDTLNNVFPSWRSANEIMFSRSMGGKGWMVSLTVSEQCLNGESCRDTEELKLDLRGFFARVSPNGRKVAIIEGRWPNSQILVMNLDGSEKKHIARREDLVRLK